MERPPDPQSANLRVGIVFDDRLVPAWHAALLEDVLGLTDCEVIVWITGASRMPFPRTRWFYRTFARIEDRHRGDAPDALALQELEGTVDYQRIETVKLATGRGHDLANSIRERNLDVLIDFSARPSLSHPEQFARFGHWYFELGGQAHAPRDGSMAGFAEVLSRIECFGSTLLVQLSGQRQQLIAYQTTSAVNVRSHYLTCNEHLWKCSTFVARALRRFQDAGPESHLNTLRKVPESFTRAPSKARLAFSFCTYVIWRFWRKLMLRGTFDRWVLMWGQSRTSPAQFDALTPPAGRFWADPHAIRVGDDVHIFFEDASLSSGMGHIAVTTRRADGTFTEAAPVLKRPYHLSYPFVFSWRGDFYMIPETAENHTIELYRCTRMPDQWEFVHNLMEDIRAFDATLLEHAGQWWLFANVAERDGASSWDELCIYRADEPTSRHWRPHCANPVISDVRCARPAGPFFIENGRLIRPSQDSSGSYGRALNFNCVVELNDTAFREVQLRKLEPDWDPAILGVHSYTSAGSLSIIDALRREAR